MKKLLLLCGILLCSCTKSIKEQYYNVKYTNIENKPNKLLVIVEEKNKEYEINISDISYLDIAYSNTKGYYHNTFLIYSNSDKELIIYIK